MPALRAICLFLFLLGTAIGALGIVRDTLDLTLAGFALWTVGTTMGVLLHRLSPTAR
jgi:type IV secretory pathway TrbD component